MVTLGYRHPDTGETCLVEVGPKVNTECDYFAVRIDPVTLEPLGEIFLANIRDLY